MAKLHSPSSLHLPAVPGSNFTLLIAYAIAPAGPPAGAPVSEINSGQRENVSFTFCSLIVLGLFGFGNVPTSWFGIPFPDKILFTSSETHE